MLVYQRLPAHSLFATGAACMLLACMLEDAVLLVLNVCSDPGPGLLVLMSSGSLDVLVTVRFESADFCFGIKEPLVDIGEVVFF